MEDRWCSRFEHNTERRMVELFRCDMCGRALPQHGDRYTLRVEKVPAFRMTGRKPYDLCPECAARLKVKLGRRDGQFDVGDAM